MSRAPIDDYRLAQAKEALRDNTVRAKLSQAHRAAAIRAEMELAAIVHRQRFLAQVRAIWRGAERDIENGGQL